MRDGELVFGVMCGSLRKGSYNRLLGEAMARLAPDGVRLQNLPSIGDVPHFDEDLHGERVPDSVEALAQAVRDADAVIISVPEYNYSFPGVLKNAVDWLSWTKPQPFANKPVFIMSASPLPLVPGSGRRHPLSARGCSRPPTCCWAASLPPGAGRGERGRPAQARGHRGQCR